MPDLFFYGSSLIAQAETGHATTQEAGHDTAEGGGHHVSWMGAFVYLALVLAIIFGLLAKAKKGINRRVFTQRFTQLFEQLYLFIENMCVGIIGPHGRKYMPFILTFWLVIFFSNLVALFMPFGPTADLGWNLAMALITVGYVQYEGIAMHYRALRAKGRDPVTSAVAGFFLHLRHFAGPSFGKGFGAILMTILLSPLIFGIEIVSELMKNVSLSLRLFGNIHGGHEAVNALNALGTSVLVPIGFFLIPIKFLTCIVQALIFTLLTCVYLSLVTHHHEEGHGDGHELAHAH